VKGKIIKRKNREGGYVKERECRGKTIREGGKPDFLTDFIFPPSLLVVPLLPWKHTHKPFLFLQIKNKAGGQAGNAHTQFVYLFCRACQKRLGIFNQRIRSGSYPAGTACTGAYPAGEYFFTAIAF
ncbi:MAG: hypothetical protein IJ080_03910, partial [Oscillospiraceae bacterium]|nr:hypothetical protein [Oscillospiraceae bacterium]